MFTLTLTGNTEQDPEIYSHDGQPARSADYYFFGQVSSLSVLTTPLSQLYITVDKMALVMFSTSAFLTL